MRVEGIVPRRLAAHDRDGLMFAEINTPHDDERARDLMEVLRADSKGAAVPFDHAQGAPSVVDSARNPITDTSR